jgi:valyl-tRNA synthetase
MISKWPEVRDDLVFEKDEADFNKIVAAIGALRAMRAERNVPPSKKVPLFIKTEEKEIFKNAEAFFQRLSGVLEISFVSDDLESCISVITPEAKMFIKQDDIVDKEKERARLQKEIDFWTREVNMLSGKLSNENFVSKAPAAVVEGEREKLKKAESMLESSKESFDKL